MKPLSDANHEWLREYLKRRSAGVKGRVEVWWDVNNCCPRVRVKKTPRPKREQRG